MFFNSIGLCHNSKQLFIFFPNKAKAWRLFSFSIFLNREDIPLERELISDLLE